VGVALDAGWVAVGVIVAVGVGDERGVGDGSVTGRGVEVASDGVSVAPDGAVSSGSDVDVASVGDAGVSVGALQARMLASTPIRANPMKTYRLVTIVPLYCSPD
jgi:hypothetical protein